MAANPFAQLRGSDSSSSSDDDDDNDNNSTTPPTSAAKSVPATNVASASDTVDVVTKSEDLLPTPPDDVWVLEETRRCAVEEKCVPCAYKILNSLGSSIFRSTEKETDGDT